jgi:hypothetical protein
VTNAFPDPLEALAALDANVALRISNVDVLAWMRSTDLQVLAATDLLIDQWPHAISPPLTLPDIDEFKRAFYRRCLRENPQDEWALSRNEAGWELANWLKYRIDLPDGEAAIARWRDWLAEEYRAGDDAIRECLINTALKHAFERREILRLFDSWKDDDVLAEPLRNRWSAE